ncbi:MAG: glycosyltransferase family 9 protein [Candidatus Brocadia sp.]|nr:glycosyltransferase family 9 protein [Candidatus Brocadia sp.]
MKELIKKPLLRIVYLLGIPCRHLFKKQFQKEKIQQILVFQLGGIGDVLRIFPAIIALRNNFPHATISTLTEFGDELFDLFPYPHAISEKYCYDPRGKHKSILNKFRFSRSLSRKNFDLIYNANRGNVIIEASIMAFIVGAPHRLGFEKNGAGFLNTVRITFKYDRYILEQNLDLLSKIDVKTEDQDIHIQIPERGKVFLDTFLKKYTIPAENFFITVHPGAKHDGQYRMWPLEKYSQLIRKIITRHKAIVILIGSKAETAIASVISSTVQSRNLINTAGQTTIPQMAALISNSNLFIGNDSGPLHIAIALKVPSLGIFSFTAPEQVIPVHQEHVITIKACNKPAYTHQPFLKFNQHDRKALEQISVQEVLEALDKFLPLKR